MSEASYSTNHSSSNERTAVLRNNVHRQECARKQQRIDNQHKELVRQLSRDEAEMRHLLHKLTLERNAKLVAGSQPDSDKNDCATIDAGQTGTSDVTEAGVVDPYPITFPCRLGANTELEPLHKKLCRQRAIESDGFTVRQTSPGNPHPRLCRQPTSPALLAFATSSLKASLKDESQVWVGDPSAIRSVRRPQKSPTKIRTGQFSDFLACDNASNMMSSITSISGINLRKGQTSSRISSRPQSCAGRFSDHSDRDDVLQTPRFQKEAWDGKASDCLSAKHAAQDTLPQLNADPCNNGQGRTVSPDDNDHPRLGSDPPYQTKKPLAKMIRQKSMQEILLHRNVLNYAAQQEDKMKPRASNTKTENEPVHENDTHPQKLPGSPRSATKCRSGLETSSEADIKSKRQLQVSANGLARTRHGSLKDRYLKDIQERNKETSSEDDGERKKSGFRRTKSLKERPEQAEKNLETFADAFPKE